MKVQSASPYERGAPKTPNGTSESPTGGRLQQAPDIPVSSLKHAAKDLGSLDAKAAAGLVGQGVSLRFKTDDISGVRVIEIVDRNSGDLVGQIPSEQVVDFLRLLKDHQDDKGNFVSRKL